MEHQPAGERAALATRPQSATSLAALDASVVEQVVIGGDLARLAPEQRVAYYRAVCESLSLNPLTQPFEYIRLNDKLRLYAKREATDQLRHLHGISVEIVSREHQGDVYVVTARATTPDGRTDEAIGAVSINGLSGVNLANQVMKCETKAKRRVTLSICGLGWIDESEVDSVRQARRVTVTEDGRELPPGSSGAGTAGDRHKLMRRWHTLCREADALGVVYETLAEDASAEEIVHAGVALRRRVDAVRSPGQAA